MRSAIILVSLIAAGPALAQANPTPAAQTPEVAAALTALEKICLPLASGSDLKTLAPSTGLRQENGDWVLPISGPERIDVIPPDSANPHICIATIHFRGNQADAMRSAIGAWAAQQSPPLTPDQVAAAEKGPQRLRTISSWQASTPKAADAVLFTKEKTLDGKPVDGALNEAQVMVSVTPTKPA